MQQFDIRFFLVFRGRLGGRHSRATPAAWARAVAAVLFACFLVGSCSRAASPPEPAPEPGGVRKEYGGGPVRVTVTLDKTSPTIAQDLTLTIRADAEPAYEVELPAFGDKLGEFGITDYRREPPALAEGGRVRTGKIYRLEPFLSGDYTIAPMTITFRKTPSEEGGKDDSGEHSITTEEMRIQVRSLLGEDRSKMEMHPVFGPVDLPSPPIPVVYLCLGLAVLLLGGAGVFFWLRRDPKSTRESVPARPAHELAYDQLRQIMEENLLERGEYKTFFSRISDVLRYYIENRFGLLAPRLTTEEFLSSIGGKPVFQPHFQRLLDEFLHHCDLVKFAEHRPEPVEIQQTVEACKAFIEATRAEPTGGETS